MAIFVLVHGGGAGGWIYQAVTRILRGNGHEVYTPTLTGVGDREHLLTPDVDLNMHILDVVKLLEFENLTDVILVGHSYGGMVITGVADHVLDRVRHLVFLDAAHPHSGESLADVAPAVMEHARKQSKVINGIELVLLPDSDVAKAFGATRYEELAWMAKKLRPHPWKSFAQPLVLSNEHAVLALPRTSINCTPTLKLRADDKIQRSLVGDNVWEIDTVHDLMISEPEKTAELLLRVIESTE